MATAFPRETSIVGNVIRRQVDATTTSGFVEEPNISHAYYRQLSDGWTLTTGDSINAWLDRFARVHTVSYQFQLTFSNWAVPQNIWVTCHELGDMVLLDVASSDFTANTTAATITSTALPVSLRPVSAKYGQLTTRDNGTPSIGTFSIGTDGVITICPDIYLSTFTNAAAGGFMQFSVMYDKRT